MTTYNKIDERTLEVIDEKTETKTTTARYCLDDIKRLIESAEANITSAQESKAEAEKLLVEANKVGIAEEVNSIAE